MGVRIRQTMQNPQPAPHCTQKAEEVTNIQAVTSQTGAVADFGKSSRRPIPGGRGSC